VIILRYTLNCEKNEEFRFVVQIIIKDIVNTICSVENGTEIIRTM